MTFYITAKYRNSDYEECTISVECCREALPTVLESIFRLNPFQVYVK